VTIAQTLYRLQEIDETIKTRERRLAEVKDQLGESEELRNARSQVEQAQEELQKLDKTQRAQELELQSVADKLASEEGRLYSGHVTNPKELAGLQKEVRYLNGRHTELEDNLLETMMAREEAASRVEERQAILEQANLKWEREQSTLVKERDGLRTTLAEMRDRKARLVDQTPAHALSTYNHLCRTKGLAVAPVENGMCTGCRVSLSAVDRQRVQSEDLVTCGNCGRIVVVLS
jgi:hypothetical protein